MIKVQTSPFIRDVISTALTSLITIFSIATATRLLAIGFGPTNFGAYSLARSIISTFALLTSFSIGVATTRYIAITKDDPYKRYNYLFGAILITVLPACFFFIAGFVFRHNLSELIFKSNSYSSTIVSSFFLILCLSFYSVIYSFYRGISKIRVANLWSLWALAIYPTIVAYFYSKSKNVELVLYLMALGYLLAVIPLCFHGIRTLINGKKNVMVKPALKELIKYSLPRLPGGLVYIGILSIGPFLAPHFGTLKDAGYLSVSQSILRIIEGGFAAFGFVALPKVAQLFSEQKHEFLKERITDIISLVFHIGLFSTLQLFIWIDLLVSIWLGNEYTPVIYFMRIIILSAIPYLLYVMLRSIIDAVEKRPINANNIYLAFMATLIISIALAKIGLGIVGLAIGNTIGILLLGIFTVYYLWQIYKFDSSSFKLKECIIYNLIFAIIALAIKNYLLIVIDNKLALILMAILTEIVLFLIYSFFLWTLKVRWIFELKKRLSPNET